MHGNRSGPPIPVSARVDFEWNQPFISSYNHMLKAPAWPGLPSAGVKAKEVRRNVDQDDDCEEHGEFGDEPDGSGARLHQAERVKRGRQDRARLTKPASLCGSSWARVDKTPARLEA
jgi:hypothetical protein